MNIDGTVVAVSSLAPCKFEQLLARKDVTEILRERCKQLKFARFHWDDDAAYLRFEGAHVDDELPGRDERGRLRSFGFLLAIRDNDGACEGRELCIRDDDEVRTLWDVR